MTRHKSPISWVGGKTQLAPVIVSLMPQHDHYVEVCCGSLQVFFAKPPSPLETINDKNGDLMNFWLVCRDHLDEFKQKVKWTPYSRRLFEIWNAEPLPDDPVERAARWFYLNCARYSAVFHGGWSYLKIKSDCGSPPARRFRSRIGRLEAVRERLADVQIECADYSDVIERFGAGERNLLYIDPPYVGSEAHYEELFTTEDHENLAALLRKAEARIILSYGDHPVVRELYKEWYIREVSVVRHAAHVQEGGRKPRGAELILTNYQADPDLFSIDLKEATVGNN